MNEPAPPTFRLVLDNDHAGLAQLAAWLAGIRQAWQLSARTAHHLELVLTEAVTNVMDYARPAAGEGRIEVSCTLAGDAIEAWVADDGPPYDPTARAPVRLPTSLDEARPGGLGIHLIRRYTTAFDYRREDGRNRLRMVLAGASAGAAEPELAYAQLPLFQGLADPRVDGILDACRRLYLGDGEQLIAADQDNHTLYLLLAGRMAARLSDRLDEPGIAIAAGESIGEMSVLDGKKTSANVYSVGDSVVLAVDETTFWERLAPLPGVMRNLTRLVIQRLRASSERMLQALTEQLRYEHLRKELAAARDIQMGLLPHHVPLFPRHPQVEVAAMLAPAKEVGGDLYDAFPIDDEHILVAVGDVSGKGMPAALFMMRTLTLLRAQVSGGLPDGGFMPALNRLLCQGNEADMFVTLCVVVLSVQSGRVVLLNGGHPPPVLARAGGPFQPVLGTRGALLGIMPEVAYQPLALQLAPGDRLVLYSDGVTEAENRQRDMLGQAGMLAALDALPGDGTMADLVTGLAGGVQGFAGDAEQSDDITILALRYLGA